MSDETIGAEPSRGAGALTCLRSVTNFHLFFLGSLAFLLPNAILASALRPFPAALVLAGCAGAGALLWRAQRDSAFFRAPAEAVPLALSLGLGLTLCLLGGEGHFFYATSDWLIRDAVLADLARNGVTVAYNHEGQDYLLRAPLGMYLVPAMAGRLFGLHAAHLTMLAQNSVLFGVVAYFTGAIANVRRAPMIALLIAFSGLDILGVAAAEAVQMGKGGAFMPFGHLEWWALYFSPIVLQYSSLVTQLFWVPNHAAPGWWFALLMLLHLRGAVGFPALLVSCALMLIWSPLAMMGAAPFVAYLALRARRRVVFTPACVAAVAAGLCFLPVAIYLTMDAGAVPHEWHVLREGFARQYAFFILAELPQAAVVLYAFNKVEPQDRAAFLLALALLLVIPVYSLGPSNDFVMRASIPALFVLAFNFARVAVLTPRDDSAFPTVISVLVLISAATPLVEIKNALGRPYAISDCNVATAWHKGDASLLPTNYWARAEHVPSWLLPVAQAPAPLTLEDRKCWADHPRLLESMK